MPSRVSELPIQIKIKEKWRKILKKIEDKIEKIKENETNWENKERWDKIEEIKENETNWENKGKWNKIEKIHLFVHPGLRARHDIHLIL